MDLYLEGCAALSAETRDDSEPLQMSSAGFSVREDFWEPRLNLHKHLVKHPAATYFFRVKGDYQDAGICPEDILLVDRALPACRGNLVIAVRHGNFGIGRLHASSNGLVLEMLGRRERLIPLRESGDETLIWGVVRQVIHSV